MPEQVLNKIGEPGVTVAASPDFIRPSVADGSSRRRGQIGEAGHAAVVDHEACGSQSVEAVQQGLAK